MKLKVCGMRDQGNIRELLKLKPDFMGMIFYSKSPRFVSTVPEMSAWPEDIKKVGVFVNPTMEEIEEKVKAYNLDLVQLHGGESVSFVKALYEKGVKVMKVFSMTDALPEARMKPYEAYVEYFLFDTKTPAYGGSGKKFDWSALRGYSLKRPFFLSGGISLEDIGDIKSLELEKLEGIDVNSRFEVEPGLKDMEKLKALKALL